MKKTELVSLVRTLMENFDSDREAATNSQTDDGSVKVLLQQILAEVKGLKDERIVMKQDIRNLKDKNETLTSAVMQHQRFLESIDAERRRQNLIITGLSEDIPISRPDPENEDGEPITATSDTDKVIAVLAKLGCEEISITSCVRLGQPQTSTLPTDRPFTRALKISVSSPIEQRKILENTKKLKAAGEPYDKIYVKKDMHPGVRREFNRLREVEKAERAKPENIGRTVEYDQALRTLSVDGVVIDQFKPSFFR